jgi:signal recognition particle subunit SRP19
MKLRDKKVIWPSNLSKDVSRREGRKIPKGIAVKSVTIDEINTAAKSLGLRVELFPKKSLPHNPGSNEGYITVNYDGPKQEILILLAEKIIKSRNK